MTKPNQKTGLWLVRFAIASFKPALEDPRISLKINDADVRVAASIEDKELGPQLLIEAKTELNFWPTRTPDGTVIVPKDARAMLEECIEYTVNIAAVGSTTGRNLSSPSVTVAFVAQSPEAKSWLKQASGYKAQEITSISVGAEIPFEIEPKILSQLGDRLEGVSLLAEALSQNSSLGKFRDLIRLYERAFRTPAGKLGQPMVNFLDSRFGYGITEINRWLDLRDRVTHADTKPERKLAYEKDVAQLMGRMLQAGYDILLNKKNWQKDDTERDEKWTAEMGTSSEKGDLFITQGKGAKIPIKILDGFGSYPLHLKGGIEQVIAHLEGDYWFKRIDQDIRKQGVFTILANPDKNGSEPA